MHAIPYDRSGEDWDKYGEDDYTAGDELPGRSRRQFFTRASVARLALVLCAIGFYGGVRVEKAQVSSSSTTTLGAAGSATSARAAGAGAAARGGTGAGSRGAGAAAPFGGSGVGGGTGAFAGGAGGLGGANSTIGTVSSIDGNNLYVTDASGNTVKIALSSASKITKSVGVSKSAIRPGDTLIVRGVKSSNGTVSATTVSDSGATASAFGGGAGSSGSSSSSASSTASSLFGGGG